MIEIIPQAVRVNLLLVEPWVLFGNIARFILVHPHQRIQSKTVVGDYVQNHGNAFGMSCVHQPLQSRIVTIRLVHSKTIRRVVPPTGVAIEFAHGHDFNGGHAEPFQMVHAFDHRIEVTGCIPIPHQKLIDDQAVLRRARV